jgi:hypothetical protein
VPRLPMMRHTLSLRRRGAKGLFRVMDAERGVGKMTLAQWKPKQQHGRAEERYLDADDTAFESGQKSGISRKRLSTSFCFFYKN